MDHALSSVSVIFRRFLRLLSTAAKLLFLVVVPISCARPPWPPVSPSGEAILERLQARQDLITSATYRLRWRARGTEPHGEFILDVAYKAPDRFRVTATGPFGVPAFTAVVVDEQFWFVDHHNREFVSDSIANLSRYQVPLSAFFSGLWREIFSGGWGGGRDVAGLSPSDRRDRFVGRSASAEWEIHWNRAKQAPRSIRITESSYERSTVAETQYGHMTRTLPYWEIERLELRGFEGGGRHEWKIISQSYNIDIPDRFFEPLLGSGHTSDP